MGKRTKIAFLGILTLSLSACIGFEASNAGSTAQASDQAPQARSPTPAPAPTPAPTPPPKSSSGLYLSVPSFQDDPRQLPTITEYPNPFVMLDGAPITTVDQWNQHRLELQDMVSFYEYGHMPPPAPVSVVSYKPDVTMGPMTNRYVNLQLTAPGGGTLSFFVNMYIPNTGGPFANGVPGNGPFPVILSGEAGWDPAISDGGHAAVGQANLETLVSRGYIVAEFSRDNFSGDWPDDGKALVFQSGVFPLYAYDPNGITGYDWTVVKAWAWGYSRVIDYLVTQSYVDKNKIGIIGHSRGGTAAAIAGELDKRIALTVDNQGGSTMMRFLGSGEQDLAANIAYGGAPGWYSPNLVPFQFSINQLPFDSPSMLGQIAPRALLIMEATQAPMEDPKGGTNAFNASREIWKAFGAENNIGLYIGNTVHEMSMEYWSAALDFADQAFFNYTVRSAPANSVSVPVSPTDYHSTPYRGLPVTHTWIAPTLHQ
jgi:hypothetical protein